MGILIVGIFIAHAPHVDHTGEASMGSMGAKSGRLRASATEGTLYTYKPHEVASTSLSAPTKAMEPKSSMKPCM